ncbi:MAG TPA: GIY-YIG nuclease family protein [Candidatus Blautia stercoravium]|nr:GIY-YIG nuclease family protein [Candidatus Blautia stercoravium]
MNYTYIVKCNDGTFYTGWTNCLEKRIACHNAGKGAKYTKVRLPVELVYYEEFLTKQEAMSREAGIKKLSRSKKIEMIEKFGSKSVIEVRDVSEEV